MLICSVALFVACDKATPKAEPEINPNEVTTNSAPKKDDEPYDGEYDGRYFINSRYYFSGVVVPMKMRFRESSPMPEYKTKDLSVYFDGIIYGPDWESTDEKYAELAPEIGDLPQKEGEYYKHFPGANYYTMIAGLERVSVKALTKYNDRYPAGSDLNDILRIEYSYYEFPCDKSKEDYAYVHEKEGAMDCVNGFKPIKYPWVAGGHVRESLGWQQGCEFFGGDVMRIGFLEAPSTPKQKFQVRVQLLDGKIFEEVTEIELNGLLP